MKKLLLQKNEKSIPWTPSNRGVAMKDNWNFSKNEKSIPWTPSNRGVAMKDNWSFKKLNIIQ